MPVYREIARLQLAVEALRIEQERIFQVENLARNALARERKQVTEAQAVACIDKKQAEKARERGERKYRPENSAAKAEAIERRKEENGAKAVARIVKEAEKTRGRAEHEVAREHLQVARAPRKGADRAATAKVPRTRASEERLQVQRKIDELFSEFL